jgi:7,8-dihydroneopterin aldolase/epimerase/oxygenase
MTIHIHQLSFFCYHGLYQQEKNIGGNFIVNLDIDIKDSPAMITSIRETVNYVTIYDMVKARMMQPEPLLETLAMEIADIIFSTSPLIEKVTVNIVKQAPPIASFEGSVGVTFVKQKG